jgi:hypothetical protein
MAAAWQAGLSPELVAASTSTLAVVEHCCATLPGGFHGYVPSAPVPKLLSDGHPWSVVTEESGVKVRHRHGRYLKAGFTCWPNELLLRDGD